MKQEQRVALVIGNGAYRSSPLRNPVNDASSMAAVLSACGFSVTRKLNCGAQEMEEAIRALGRQIQRGGVGLFYYAGHGIQVEGRNYLVPVGTEVQEEDEVKFKCIDAGLVLEKMEGAGNRVNIVILDACRNNPFARSFRSSQRGLAQMDAATGSLLAYATAPGAAAADGEGANGLYTSKLIEHMQEPGLRIEDLFMKVRREVMDATGGEQVPWESTSLTGPLYLVLPTAGGLGPVAGGGGLGKLFVDSQPRGARIVLDEVEQRAVTPATLEVGPGTHRVQVVKEELAWAGEVRVQRDRLTQVRETLAPGSGSLIVTTNPPDVDVYLDEVLVGKSPLQLDQVPATWHRLRISGTDIVDQDREVQVVRGSTASVDATLEMAGFISVTARPGDVQVTLDGAPMGVVPLVHRVRPGTCRVRLSAEGYEPVERAVSVAAGARVAVDETLPARPGELQVDTAPAGAHVELAGSGRFGITPVVFEQIPEGTYSLRVVLADYQEALRSVSVARGARTVVSLNLQQLQPPDNRQEIRRRLAAYGGLTLSAVCGVGAYLLDRRARDAYDRADAAYARYRQSTITSDAKQLRAQAEAWYVSGDARAKKRNVAAGLSAGLAGVSLKLLLPSF